MPLDPLRFENPLTEGRFASKTSEWFQRWLSKLVIVVDGLSAAGALRGTLNPDERPVLTADDAGFLFYSTDYQHTYRWTGTAWEYAPGDEGSGFIAHFRVAPRTGTWQLCNGTAGVYESLANGTRALVAFSALAAGTMPDLTSTVSYLRNAAACTGVLNAAVSPAISGQTSNNDSSAEVQFGAGTIVAAHTHQHAIGTLLVAATAQPRNMDTLPYYRL